VIDAARAEGSVDMYRGMFDNALWGIFQTTVDGHYIRVNRALARIYGYGSPQELIAATTDISRQIYVDRTRRETFLGLMAEQGIVSAFESEVFRRDGSVIWISESCRVLRDDEGEIICFEGSVEDISARKRVEVELERARAHAEQANRAKSVFLANMSHELRTPLNAILGFSEILEKELFGPLGDERYIEFARDIYRSGSHLLDIIGNILDLAKVEAGQFKLDEQEVDLVDIVRSSERLIAEAARRKDIRFGKEIPRNAVLIKADMTRLRQILLNLLSNAVKFTPDGGDVTLTCCRDGDDVALSVADTGIGIEPSELDKVMQPFHQADNSLSRRYEGAGLGLPLTQSLVGLHGGTMRIDSQPGKGTVVVVRLPGWRIIDWGSLSEAGD
jgi:PAS domain S-box-containing protein